MLYRQRGELNLLAVGIFSAILAAVAMAALFSMRSDRNLFAEGAAKLGKAAGESAKAVVTDSGGPMRKCVINGKTVVSNTECTDQNKTSKTIKIQDNRGFEAPKKPPEPAPEATSDKAIDKMIEKQLQ
jgi:hypothetical protein